MEEGNNAQRNTELMMILVIRFVNAEQKVKENFNRKRKQVRQTVMEEGNNAQRRYKEEEDDDDDDDDEEEEEEDDDDERWKMP